MNNKWIYVGYAAAWLATSIAVCTGIDVTKSLVSLWAMLIPAGLCIENKKQK